MRLVASSVAVLAASLVWLAQLHGQHAAPVMYRDVAPIFDAKCTQCHVTGGIAPFSLTSAAEAHKQADLIKLMTQSRLMPPWMPGPDSKPFVGQSLRQLTPRERLLIAQWVDDGARIGPYTPIHSTKIEPKGLVLTPPAAYLPSPDVGIDDYHCTLLDPRLPRGGMVTAAQVIPGRPDIVHHVILYELTGRSVQDARAMNNASGGKGWTCFGGPGVGEDSVDHAHWLGVWVPGKTNNAFPPGTGMSFPKGAAIVMQIHYNLNHPAQPDRTRVVLRFAPPGVKVKPLETKLFLAPIELPCPAGVKNPMCNRSAELRYLSKEFGQQAAAEPLGLLFLCGKTLAQATGTTTSCDRRLPYPTTIYAVAGHMHVRGVDIRIELNPGRPGATLLHIPAWNFHWQDMYTLQKPIHAPAGSVVRVTCHYDNSPAKQPIVDGKPQPPHYVVWGEGTGDEMCLGVLQTSVTP